jgi:hypothetical protein
MGHRRGWEIELVLAEVSCPSSQARPFAYSASGKPGKSKQQYKKGAKQDHEDGRDKGVSESAQCSCRPDRNRPGQRTAISGSPTMPDAVFRETTFEVGE